MHTKIYLDFFFFKPSLELSKPFQSKTLSLSVQFLKKFFSSILQMAEVSLVSFIIVTASTDLSTMSYFSIISISPFAFQCPKYVFKFTKHSFYLFQIWQSHYSALFSFLKIVFLPKYFCSQIALIFLSTGLMSKQLVSQIVLKL